MMHNTGITSGTAAAEAGALSVNGPQPVWMTLNEARERGFTGEVVFEVDPEVHAYLDNGVVYYAERESDPSLGRRLLDLGLLDSAQLERGTVRVGDVEHLGRLFDRDPSVDRDAVLVMTETVTEELIAGLANHAVTTVRATAYRHHASGLHRWFVAPVEASTGPRPISEVAQLDTTVVDSLPGLPVATPGSEPGELTIEWDEPLDVDDAQLSQIDDFDASMLEAMLDHDRGIDFDDLDLDIEPAQDAAADSDVTEVADVVDSDTPVDVDFDALVAEVVEADVDDDTADDDLDDLAASIAADELASEDPGEDRRAADADQESVDVRTTDEPVFTPMSLDVASFSTNGNAVHPAEVDADAAAEVDDDARDDAGAELALIEPMDDTVEIAPVDDDLGDFEFQVVWPDGSEELAADPEPSIPQTNGHAPEAPEFDDASVADTDAQIETPAAALSFEIPPLVVDDEPAADDSVPDDVAEAVRRAIAAIETSTLESPSLSPIADPAPQTIADAPAAETPAATSTTATPAAAPSGFGGFAPPTPDTSVEAIYAREAAEIAQDSPAAEAAPARGVASVVFVDDEADDDSGDRPNERTSALRRLIGGLRRKDR